MDPRSGMIGALALTLIGCGCRSPRESVSGTDRDTFYPGVRVSWVLHESPPLEDSAERTRTSVDLDLTGSNSTFTQEVESGSLVEVGGTLFVGPTTLDTEFDLLRASASLRHGKRAASGMGLEGFVGWSYADLDLTVSDSSTSSSVDYPGVGFLLGATVFYEPNDWLRLYAEGSLNPTLSAAAAAGEFADINTLDLGASLRFAEFASLRVSWRQVTFKAQNDQFSSDLHLRSSGPAIALAFTF